MTKGGENYASTMGAMGLFVSTVLLSQILQYTLERWERRNEEKTSARDLYEKKRLSYRLSYTNVTDIIHDPSQQPDVMGALQPCSADCLKEDIFDSIPKNSNWNHFESSNEEDAKFGIVASPIDGGEDEASSSSSSSEEFLWTRAGTTQRRRESRPKSISSPLTWISTQGRSSSEPLASSWLSRLKQRIGVKDEIRAAASDEFTFESVHHRDLNSTNSDEILHPCRLPSKPLAGIQRSASTPAIRSSTIAHTNQRVRESYNARIMPDKVVMVRHGQSEGNVNEALYSTTPDNAMRLTKLGWEQARKAGQVLKEQVLISGEPIHFIVSPYVRTVETFHGIVSAWCNPKEFDHIQDRKKRLKAWYGRLLELGLTWHEDPRIREQDFGNYQVPEKIKLAKEERHRFGPFFYRFAHGESASDVFDRVSTFLDSLWRAFDLNKARNYVLVTHGISIRVLLARYFRYSIDQFSLLANPRNCEMVVLCHDGAGKLQLEGRYEVEIGENENTREKEVRGYKFYQRLRVLPEKYVHKLNVRISYDDKLGPPEMIGNDSTLTSIASFDAGEGAAAVHESLREASENLG